jgi:16S rRNA (guanine527-N7)-methyltransferase
LLEIGGAALLPKGTAITDELAEGRRAAALLGAEITAAALLPTGETRLVVAKKLRATLRTYPRRAGVATRSPLGRRS